MKRLPKALGSDGEFYAAILIYGLAALAAALWLGDPGWFVPLVDLSGWTGSLGAICLVMMAVWAVRSVGKEDFAGAFLGHVANWPQRLAGVCLFLSMGVFLGIFTSVKTMMPHIAPFAYDRVLADIDRSLHGADPWTYLRWMTPFEGVIRWVYGPVAGGIMSASSFFVCVTDWERRRQYLWAFLLCWVLLGNIAPLAFMAAGPVFYHGITGSTRFAELSDFIFGQASAGDFTSSLPGMLWEGYTDKTPGFGMGISAFPSMHVSITTLFALAAFAMHRRIGYVMLAYLVFIVAASVHLGWHYAIDGYVSILATVIIWKLAGMRAGKAAFASRERQLA